MDGGKDNELIRVRWHAVVPPYDMRVGPQQYQVAFVDLAHRLAGKIENSELTVGYRDGTSLYANIQSDLRMDFLAHVSDSWVDRRQSRSHTAGCTIPPACSARRAQCRPSAAHTRARESP